MNDKILSIIGGIALVIALLSPFMRSDSRRIKGLFEKGNKLFVQEDYAQAIAKYKETIDESIKREVEFNKGKDFIALANYKIAVSYVKLAEKSRDIGYYGIVVDHIKKVEPTEMSTEHQDELPHLWEDLLNEIGLANYELKNYEDSQSAFNMLLKGFPRSEFRDNARFHVADVLVKEAEAFINKYQYSTAINVLQKAKNTDPEYKAVYYNLGIAYLRSGKLESAKNTMREVLKRDPHHHAARQLLGTILDTIKQKHHNLGLNLLHERKYNQAIHKFREAINIDQELNGGRKGFKEAYYNLGVAYFELGDFEKAKIAATDALSISRDYYAASILQRNATNHINYKHGLTHLKNWRYRQAISIFKKIVKSDSTFTEAYYNLGRAYLGDENLEEAERAARKAFNQNHPSARQLLQQIKWKCYNLGINLLRNKKNYEAAKTKLTKAIVLDKELNKGRKTFKEAYYNLGLAYFGLGEFGKAKEAATDALSIGNYQAARHLQRNATNHINYERGLTYLKNRRYKQAILAFKGVVKSDSTFTAAYHNLGKAYFEDNNLEAAENAAKKAYSQNYWPARQLLQQIKEKYYDIGLNALEKDWYTEAVSYIKKAVELGMKSKKVYTNLAIAYAGSGKFELAKNAAKAALRIDPNYRPALQILNSID